MKHGMIVVSRQVASLMSQYCNEPSDVPKNSVPFDYEVEFKDGCRMAIQVCAPLRPLVESCWTQGVLFDKKGNELGCTDVGESLLGEYQVSGYEVTVYEMPDDGVFVMADRTD